MFDGTKNKIKAQIQEPIKNNAILSITALVIAVIAIFIAAAK